jgi:hypothetical protein
MRAMRFSATSAGMALAACLVARPAWAQEPAAGRGGQSEASLATGTAIYAELNGSLDSKKAKVGDPVAAHTTEAVKSNDARTILPKGTKLVGHIAQASARSKGDGQSELGIAFDKASLKDGGEVALYARIQALAPPASFSSSSADYGSSPSPSNTGTTQTSPMGGSRAPQAPSANPGTIPTGARPADAGASAQPGLAPTSRGVIGMRGLTLTTAPMGNTLVSMVASEGKNVHLDSGTRLLLVTQTSGPEGPAQ